MKNPNGFGSEYKLAGKRRNPFVARKTTGWDDDGSQIITTVGYYKTRSDAMLALADYNSNPYTVNASTITFEDVYNIVAANKFDKISVSSANGYKASFKTAKSLHQMKFADIKTAHLQSVIDKCDLGHSTLRKIKVLYNQMYKYAMANDIISKDYSKFVEIGVDEKESSRRPFSNKEIQLLWDSLGRLDFIDTVLIMIYSGLRPGELVTIENANIDIENRIMRGGLKTAAGKNRIIPINKKILPFVKARFEEGNTFLISNNDGNQMSYYTYYDCKFKVIMEQLQLNHKPHDCRHTFATLMDNAGANKVAIKRIMGHASTDITDKVYTHKDVVELLKAIDLI